MSYQLLLSKTLWHDYLSYSKKKKKKNKKKKKKKKKKLASIKFN